MILARLRHALENRFFPPTPLVEVGIQKERLIQNLRAFQAAYPTCQLAPVLKSNAYGHGLVPVARILDRESIAFFMVDSFYEARRLRASGIRSRIVVMGFTRPEHIVGNHLPDVDFAVTDTAQLMTIAKEVTRPIRVHLKLDTGMHRQGITPEELPEALKTLKSTPLITVVGVCSHFADADTDGSPHAALQVRRWNEMSRTVRTTYPDIAYRHLSATKGVRFAKEADTNVIRLGIGLYGFDTSHGDAVTLAPALELRSIIGTLRTVAAGESVGYNASHTLMRTTRIATVPMGYYEGIDRRLSNKGVMQVRGVDCPIIGRVSMNMTALDVTDVPDVAVGDTVIGISQNLTDANAVPAIAQTVSEPGYQESEYVILVHIPLHLKRVVE